MFTGLANIRVLVGLAGFEPATLRVKSPLL